MAIRRIALTAAAVAALTCLSSPPTSADAGVEAQVMAKIRAARPNGLILHSGLLAVARQHSMYMSNQGRMGHDNADQRISNAPPDPAEANGAPDDGVPVAAWCENVTYSTGHPASEVPRRIYSQWEGSGAHERCMRDTSRNVGAVGVHYDGTTWWATFIATTDKTPPGGARPVRTAAPTPEPAPVQEAAPAAPSASAPDEPAAAGSGSGSGSDPALALASVDEEVGSDDQPATVDDDAAQPKKKVDAGVPGDLPALDLADDPFVPVPATASAAYGWQELAAVGAVLALASFLLRRRTRPGRSAPVYFPPEVERRDDVPLPEGELVGAGASYT